jgi:hypothetical protein
LKRKEKLLHSVAVLLLAAGQNVHNLGHAFLLHVASGHTKDLEARVNVPLHRGPVLVGGQKQLRHNVGLELGVGNLEKGEKLLHKAANVALVDECKDKGECAAADGDVGLAKAVDNRVSVALYSLAAVVACLHRAQKRRQGDILDVAIVV